jgi:hypothetical protein
MHNQSFEIKRIAGIALVLLSLFTTFVPHTDATNNSISNPIYNETPELTQTEKTKVAEDFGKLPLTFEQNNGQTDKAVKFLARNPRYTMFLTNNEAVFVLRTIDESNRVRRQALQMQVVGANKEPRIEGLDKLVTKSNYFIGDDRDKWHSNVNNFARVAYREMYPGIDMVYYGKQRQLEYDFIVAPGVDSGKIKLAFKGARKISLDEKGNLRLKLKEGEMMQPAPVIYQEKNGGREQIAGRFVIDRSSQPATVGFEVDEYDRSLPLVIDPKLLFSTYIGGNIEFIDIVEGIGDFAAGVAVDTNGNVYITGNTDSTDFPVTSGAFQEELELRGDDACLIAGPLKCGDAFVMKLNTTGTQIVYSTYIGGHNSDEGRAIAVDATGRAYITGGTDPFNAGNFCINPYLWPTTLNPYQNKPCYGARADSDAFFTVLTAAGDDLVYSTYYGGGDEDIGNGIAIDAAGNAYIAGGTNSNNLPDKNAFQPDRASEGGVDDAFIAKFNPAETGNDSFLYGSYLGGTGQEVAIGVATDSVGNAYIVGVTASNNLATKAPSGLALQRFFNGGQSDGFVAKVDVTNASGPNSLVYLTYYGGVGTDAAIGVAVEPITQRAHITGSTDNATGFPLLNAFDSSAALNDAFVAKLNADGTAQFYSSLLGGNSQDVGRGIALDAANNVYLTGETLSSNFPNINAFQTTRASSDGDAFVTKISAVAVVSQPKILYSSFHGGGGGGGAGKEVGNGIAVDKKGNVYIAGKTASATFPTTAGVVKTSAPGVSQFNLDGFVAKIESTFADTIGVFNPAASQFRLRNSNTAGPIDQTVNFGQPGDIPVVGDWDGNGIKDPGVFRPGTGQFIIKKLSITFVCNPICLPSGVSPNLTINFGQIGDLPVAGDWDRDGVESVGVFRPSAGQFFMTDDNVANPNVDHSAVFGQNGDLPVAGDWNSDGRDTVGVFRPSAATFFLTNQDVLNPSVDIVSVFGVAEDLPVAGDYDGDGKDTIGVWRPSVATFFLSNNNTAVDITAQFGTNGDRPVVGDWDGKP